MTEARANATYGLRSMNRDALAAIIRDLRRRVGNGMTEEQTRLDVFEAEMARRSAR